MDPIDHYANLLIEASRVDPALRNALSHLPPLYEPIDHYHCSCCGRVVTAKGTSRFLPDLLRLWLGAALNIVKTICHGLKYFTNNVIGLQSRLKPGILDGVKARICRLWLTFCSPDNTVRETNALYAGSYQSTASQEMMERRPRRKGNFKSWRSLGKPSGLRSTTGELVRSIEPHRPMKSDKLLDSCVKAVESVQLQEPIDAAKLIMDRDQKYHEKDAMNHTQKLFIQDATSRSPYTEQKFWGASNDTPLKPRSRGRPRHLSVETIPSLNPLLTEPKPPTVPLRTPTPRIPISATSKETFSRLFTSNPKTRKLLHFDAIVAALEDAGLTAKRGGKCSGSAVTFKHRGGQGSIVFHCPHPEPKIEFHKQRTWGTRLQNKFGWELGMFVVRGA